MCKNFDWRLFPLTSLSLTRFDLYYDLDKTDSFTIEELDQFLLKSRSHTLDDRQIIQILLGEPTLCTGL